LKKNSGKQSCSDFDSKTFDWNNYYKNKSNQTPRDTLVMALDIISNQESKKGGMFAIDVGCGHGADTLELLKKGWKVLATDADENGLRLLNESVDKSFKENLKTEKLPFEEFGNAKLKKCDLLNASYCLPFCKPEYFEILWNKISDTIKKGGMFSGQFFGENDEWAGNKEMTFLKIKKVNELFRDFEVLYFEEKDEDGKTASGDSKHWHVFSVIAEKLA
jgi:tellurite methyltransferase